jgi:GNAT superfamily N-acetyltransferase
LNDCFDRDGTFYGAFENSTMIGVVVLESKFIGRNKDQLQLKFLHVSASYRKKGLGRILFEKAVAKAREMGAQRLYVSATLSENTVRFYTHLGCVVTKEINQELFKLEPEDIHLEYAIP